MLYELYVENFAIIGKMRLQLGPALNALTGETGAGKSLVVDAVALLIGGRGSDSFIRSGFDRCLVEGVFARPFSAELTELLSEQGLLPEEEEMLILSRELVRGGRSVCRANGRTVSLSQLRGLGRLLLNIHGQMEHMLLLEEDQQLLLLDSYGGEAQLSQRQAVAEAYKKLQEQRKRLAEYQASREQRAERMELLRAQIKELTEAELQPGQEEELREESRRLSNAEKLTTLAREAQRALDGSSAVLESLNLATVVMHQASGLDSLAEPLSQRLESLYYEAEDVAREISRYENGLGLDAYRLEEVENRLGLLSRLRKKYGGESAEMLTYLTQAQQELSDLDELDFSGGKTTKALAEAEEAYEKAAAKLSKLRATAAHKLGQAITQELHLLCMEQAEFQIELPGNEPASWGREKCLYMIRTNTGEEMRPVAKIASGGELSRIVLGMKVILAQLDQVPTLVFDEVDSGLGGRALTAVADRLAFVGESTQAILVTHAPVMAAAAQRQLHIEKQVVEGRTEIAVQVLEGAARVDELARMIAGSQITDVTRAQAAELLRQHNH